MRISAERMIVDISLGRNLAYSLMTEIGQNELDIPSADVDTPRLEILGR
jgi:hypothetical protein